MGLYVYEISNRQNNFLSLRCKFPGGRQDQSLNPEKIRNFTKSIGKTFPYVK